MSDDLTTKPCPYRSPDVHTEACPNDCHGTGRVPMTTAELWDACVAIGDAEAHQAHAKMSCFVRHGASGEYRGEGILYRGDTLDDALRAALRGVAG